MRRGAGLSHCGKWIPVPGGPDYDWTYRFVCNRQPDHRGRHRSMLGWEWAPGSRTPRRIAKNRTA